MKYLLVSDIHGNLAALEAVLKDARFHGYDSILSLGDQINLGPCSKEVLDRLNSINALCLHGNHERYVLSAMAHDPVYQAANFESVRFLASQLKPEEITFERTMKIGNTTLCHALPEDDSFPVFDPERALPRLLEMPHGSHIVCGHGHDRTHLRAGEWVIDCIGSTGCMDYGIPGTAMYTIATVTPNGIALQAFTAEYDTGDLPYQYLKSGMADYAPIMSHLCCLKMMSNRDFLVDFVTKARMIAEETGATTITDSVWHQCDSLYRWPDGMTSSEFWKRYR